MADNWLFQRMTMAMAEWVKTIGMSTHLAVATFLRWLGKCPIKTAWVQLLMWPHSGWSWLRTGNSRTWWWRWIFELKNLTKQKIVITFHNAFRSNTRMWTTVYLLMGLGMSGKAEVPMTDTHTGLIYSVMLFCLIVNAYPTWIYRYSPLLAYMMVPNMWSPSMGKLIFVMFDIFAGHLIYCILRCRIHLSRICK